MTDQSSSAHSNATGIALGASFTVVIVLFLGALILFILRRRRQAFTQLHDPEGVGRPSVALGHSHPASRVTPFLLDREQDGPRFSHTPGEAMRIARRRSDGGWDFSAPLPPLTATNSPLFTPGYAMQLSASACPSPTASSITLIGTGWRAAKDKKVPGELTTRGFVERDADSVIDITPPPAYTPRRFSSRSAHGHSQSTPHF